MSKKAAKITKYVGRTSEGKSPQLDSIARIRKEMEGCTQRFIHTGELLVKGGRIIHLQG